MRGGGGEGTDRGLANQVIGRGLTHLPSKQSIKHPTQGWRWRRAQWVGCGVLLDEGGVGLNGERSATPSSRSGGTFSHHPQSTAVPLKKKVGVSVCQKREDTQRSLRLPSSASSFTASHRQKAPQYVSSQIATQLHSQGSWMW